MANRDARGLRGGPWHEEDDEILTTIVGPLSDKHWDALAKQSGLRSGKSCRLRWINYLQPNLKHGEVTQEEEAIILDLHKQWSSNFRTCGSCHDGPTTVQLRIR
ncbi:hypothetical protein SSX86_008049 [Deinandra increscens subsp. villosa]|uniref:Uncharacterized protein n=1 Tax=Deinandra increscens subsp. villosa TaxID=3103831 RepID=A0AAP0DAJ8_9ASTR